MEKPKDCYECEYSDHTTKGSGVCNKIIDIVKFKHGEKPCNCPLDKVKKMTISSLYKFVKDYKMRWSGSMLLVWIPIYDIQEFINIVGNAFFDDGGLDVNLQSNHICVDLVDVCGYDGIDPEDILKPDAE